MMCEYKGPKTYLEFVIWHGNRKFEHERVGQAFFNDFGFEVGNSHECRDVYLVLSMLTDALAEKYPDFYMGL